MYWEKLLSPVVLPFLLGGIAIVGGISVKITKMLIRHRERLAMIERGIHPDASPPPEQAGR